jgi:DNA-binding MarR family transcriptional regulator
MRSDDVIRRLAELADTDLFQQLTSASTATGTKVFTTLAERGYPVRAAHMPVFGCLEAAGTNISTLASRAGVSRQAMSGLVHDIEVAGYVRTFPDPTDKRALMVELTERGVEFCEMVAEVAAELTEQWRVTLGSERYEALMADLRSISDS